MYCTLSLQLKITTSAETSVGRAKINLNVSHSLPPWLRQKFQHRNYVSHISLVSSMKFAVNYLTLWRLSPINFVVGLANTVNVATTFRLNYLPQLSQADVYAYLAIRALEETVRRAGQICEGSNEHILLLLSWRAFHHNKLYTTACSNLVICNFDVMSLLYGL